jgi:glycosyltransferase involved in cell wall biosynthesis
MNIVFIDQTGQLGGGELSLLDYLGSVRQHTRVILFEDGPFRSLLEDVGETVDIVPIDALSTIRRGASISAFFSALPNIFKLRSRLSKSIASADILYANSQKAFLLAVISKKRGQRIVWHLRDLLTKDHFSVINRRLAVFAGNRGAFVIIANSQATADAFVAQGGSSEKLRVVADGIDPAIYDAVDPALAKHLHTEFAPSGQFLVGLFGRLAHWKGQHVLLEAAARIPGLQVCLVGGPLFGEDAYEAKLRERAALPDLAGRVHFLGFRTDIPELMSAMDLVVHSSVSAEPLGRVILEGMLARKPVIATRAGGAAEIVEAEQSGLLVEPDSAEELEEAILRLKSDSALRDRLANAGRLRAETVYSLKQMVDRTNKVLEEASLKS